MGGKAVIEWEDDGTVLFFGYADVGQMGDETQEEDNLTTRVPLPRAALQSIDEARMAGQQALEQILAVIDDPLLSRDDKYRRLGLALHHLYQCDAALREASAEAKSAANGNGG